MGILLIIFSSFFSSISEVIAVLIKPGAIQFAVIPRLATSSAIDLVIPSRPALEAA